MSRANDQSELTQMTYFGGENAGGLTRTDGVNPLDAFWFVKS